MNLQRDIKPGDRLHVRYEQAFTAEGAEIGVGRVMWAEHVGGSVALEAFGRHLACGPRGGRVVDQHVKLREALVARGGADATLVADAAGGTVTNVRSSVTRSARSGARSGRGPRDMSR